MYRIPNLAMSLNDAFEIVSILTPQTWDTIITYSDVITKKGSDFDMSFVISPHTYNVYYNKANGKLEKIGYNNKALKGASLKGLDKRI